ncbi:MAG TPA: protein kinase [Polyangiaceae bacterium]|nr:protein kinase [Polyangiaceae bacterium]
MTPGYILADKYRLVSLLGRGGMGAVWRAERLEWGSPVAVKLMDRASEARPDVLARFQQESRLAARLRSAHVVQVLDDGRDPSTGTPFIVMELLPGETLAQRLARVQRLSPSETSRIVTHVARALALAHDLGMVHRDLKPDNIFLVPNDDEETAKVLDFGIAKWQREILLDAPTSTGIAIGTPSYMSPEQIKDSKRVDHRSDLWSLALIASECLTGRRAFEADNLLSLALQICNEPPPSPSSFGGVPAGFDAWFEQATARRLDQRFGSARELAEQLRRVCGVAEPAASEPRAPERVRPVPDAASYEPTEVLRPSPPHPSSNEGLTRTEGAVAAMRPGRRRRRVLSVLAAATFLATVGVALRSELTSGAAPRRAAAGTQRATSLALRSASSEPVSSAAAASPVPAAPAPSGEGAVRTAESSAVGAPPAAPADTPAGGGAPGEHADTHGRALQPLQPGAVTLPVVASRDSPAPALDVGAAPALTGDGADSSPVARDGARPAPPAEPSGEGAAAAIALAAAPVAPSSAASSAASSEGAAAAPVGSEAVATAGAEAVPTAAATPGGKAFDREAARVALELVATQVKSCRPPGGPRGRGRVQLRFEPSGRVGAAWLMTPQFDNTVAGSCVRMLFRRAIIPEFTGAPVLVTKTFEIP